MYTYGHTRYLHDALPISDWAVRALGPGNKFRDDSLGVVGVSVPRVNGVALTLPPIRGATSRPRGGGAGAGLGCPAIAASCSRTPPPRGRAGRRQWVAGSPASRAACLRAVRRRGWRP